MQCKKKCVCGLKYVFIPTVLEATTLPIKGAYCNAIVEYESGAVYIYSNEGIPVLVKEGNGT